MKDLNKVVVSGRATGDAEVRYTAGNNPIAIGRYTLAVNRIPKDGEEGVDFLRCVSFGSAAQFAEKYVKKGTKLFVVGRIQTGSYTNKNGVKIPTFEIVVEEQGYAAKHTNQDIGDGFMNIPDGLDESMPWN